jgi:predicted ATP-grasp superfamily ATP-dependent carboligase
VSFGPDAPPAATRVLVTDSDTRSALAVTRALGRCGYTVYSAGEHRESLAAVSRYSSGFAPYPAPAKHPRDFVVAVAEAAARLDIDVIVPTAETTTLLLTRHATMLPARTRLPFADAGTVERAANKAEVLKLALECGIPIPRTEFIETPSGISAVGAWSSYPAVVKPARSRVATANGWLSMGVRYAKDSDETLAILRALPPEAYPVLLQERIQGAGTGVFACMVEGQPLAWFAHERLREKPPSGGVSVLCRSVQPEPRAVQYAQHLLQKLRWQGVAMVEFKRDDRDGSLRLMEINGRLWGSLQLAIDAGVNFPRMMVELASGRTPAPVSSYRIGVRNRWFWGDLSSLLLQLLGHRRKLNLPPAHPGRLAALWQFMHLWGPGLHYEVERLSDLRPAWLETRSALFGSRR